ncbi:MAG: hypothetical protein J7K04_07420 [Spirochaetales bacterium]|nr:hypothetical protein [Spirochaetales bacterium]
MKKIRYKFTFWMVLVSALALQAAFLTAEGEAESMVPLKKVVLFSSGVGYFERDGYVEGNASLELSFNTDQINDILKSIVLRDFDGGSVSRINYASKDPLNKALKAFSVDLSGNPGLPSILNQTRGEPVEVTSESKLKGKIISVESTAVSTAEGENTVYSLNLWTDEGIVNIKLTDIKDIRFLNPALNEEFKEALSLIASGHSKDKKKIVLHFTGTGKRRVSVGYLIGAPVWKTSYRVVIGKGEKHFLQGWAIVENTTDENWNGISLSLISGQPISFRMDLYKPFYISRPFVALDIQRQVQSQVYENNLEYSKELAAKKPLMSRAPAVAREKAAPLGLQQPAENEMDISRGVSASARGESAGEFFEYSIKMPVSVKRQESAMIPIINTEIEGKRVSIYNSKTDPVHPVNGLELKNTTDMYLTAGPITVFEQGIYAGDSRIKTLAPNGQRLISYSVDLDTEVKEETQGSSDIIVSAKIVHGTMITGTKRVRETLYTIKNSGKRGKHILIEHPVISGWKLVEPKKAYEKSRIYYRFLVDAGGEGEKSSVRKLKVIEEKYLSRSVMLSNLNSGTVEFYLSAKDISDGIKEALKKISKMTAEIAELNSEIKSLQREYSRIQRDQERIRKNMSRLSKTSKLYKRYMNTLNSQEDSIDKIIEKLDELETKQDKQQAELNNYISSLNVE